MDSYNIDTIDEIDDLYDEHIRLALIEDLDYLDDLETVYDSDDDILFKKITTRDCGIKVTRKYPRKSTRKQALFRKSSKFHMMDKETRNKIMDQIEKVESGETTYAKIAREFEIEYQNLLKWKLKGVLKRPDYDWPNNKKD